MLTGHRADLVADRVRMINRLRDLMTSVFPGLERAFDYASRKGALVLLTGYASPHRIRRIGHTRLAAWLRQRKVRDSAGVAARAIAAARAQMTVLPGQDLATSIIAELATNILALDERLRSLDAQIAETFDQHPQAAVIQSMPGFGPLLGACLLVGAGDLPRLPQRWPPRRRRRTSARPERLRAPHRQPAPPAVLQPTATTRLLPLGPNQHAAGRTEPRLLPEETRHGRTHSQAIIALARRRVDVLWALLRENRTWTTAPPVVAQAA